MKVSENRGAEGKEGIPGREAELMPRPGGKRQLDFRDFTKLA